jgi:hypothetical protein
MGNTGADHAHELLLPLCGNAAAIHVVRDDGLALVRVQDTTLRDELPVGSTLLKITLRRYRYTTCNRNEEATHASDNRECRER